MATGMKTAHTCITNAEKIIAEFADRLTDEGRADLAAVVAMAKLKYWHDVQMVLARKRSFKEEYDEACQRAFDAERDYYKAMHALAAAGVEVKA